VWWRQSKEDDNYKYERWQQSQSCNRISKWRGRQVYNSCTTADFKIVCYLQLIEHVRMHKLWLCLCFFCSLCQGDSDLIIDYASGHGPTVFFSEEKLKTLLRSKEVVAGTAQYITNGTAILTLIMWLNKLLMCILFRCHCRSSNGFDTCPGCGRCDAL
jgi:hypothetical protein